MTKDEFREVLRLHIAKKYRRQSAAAKEWGVSEALVSHVLKGRKSATEAMLADAGFERIQPEAHYRKVRAKA